MIKILFASVCATSAFSLSGCVVMSPSPIVEAANLLGSAISGVSSMTPATPQNPIVFAHAPIKEICIEWNGAVALSDFVPSLQTELQRHGVPSRVYEAGTQPGSCSMTLAYAAFVKWDMRSFSNAYMPYLTFASVTLRKEGRVVGSASYKMGSIAQDKWSSTGSKLGPVVDALLISNPVVEATNSVGTPNVFGGS